MAELKPGITGKAEDAVNQFLHLTVSVQRRAEDSRITSF